MTALCNERNTIMKKLLMLGLALLLNPKIFDPVMWENNGGMLVITAWWGVWHIISGLTLAMIWRANGRKEHSA